MFMKKIISKTMARKNGVRVTSVTAVEEAEFRKRAFGGGRSSKGPR
jgi:hypothetical protein